MGPDLERKKNLSSDQKKIEKKKFLESTSVLYYNPFSSVMSHTNNTLC
jgi:hypothetical protein